MSSNSNHNTTVEKLISACTGALITSLMVTPMDVIKMRLQTQQNIFPSKRHCCTWNPCNLKKTTKSFKMPAVGGKSLQVANIHECAALQQPMILKGTTDGIYKILKYEGARALWKGLSPSLVMSVPGNVIYFVGYEQLKDSIPSEYAPLVAGAAARTIAVAMISPIELFRTRLQAVGSHDFKHVLQGVKDMVIRDGPQALWRGLPPTLWRDVPFSALYWMGYEECKKLLRCSSRISELEASFVAGALSGMFAAAVTTPFDVAKTKRQVNSVIERTSTKTRVPAILKQIYLQEGVSGLFRGLTPRIAKVAPSCAIMISSYEMGKVLFLSQHKSL
ncbi:mitochondrial carrier domain-containing protein [Sporodiniella umbellata]|nr:mitochondrial carrier domain-containing protein [Sporodiniella umbellata]